jgi:hypothetical protein
MNKKILTHIIVCLVIVSGILSCSDSESRMSPLLKQTTVILNLGLPPENPGALNDSLWNRIRRFFVKDAVAQTAPAAFSSILVRVIGADFGVMEKEFGPYGAVSLNVPSGSLRQFEVIAYSAPGDPSAALSFRGTAVANLPAGETVSIPVLMGLNETKIVVPDPFGSSPRIVQINDMSGAGWIAKIGTDIGFSAANFYPYDIDFDTRGRIYIANNNGASGYDVVIRIDNINSTSYTPLGSGSGSGIVTLTVDRIRNYVYYATSAALGRCNLDGTNPIEPITLTFGAETMSTIRGMDIDANGILYVAGSNGLGQGRIYRFDTSQNIVTNSYTTNLNTPWDTTVRPPYVYIANYGGPSAILQLDMNLQFVGGYGTIVAVLDTTPGHFYGPERFLAIRNDALIIIDEGSSLDKLVSIRDITGSNWLTYGSTGEGVGQFRFYQC